jgi:Sulfotransferase domain
MTQQDLLKASPERRIVHYHGVEYEICDQPAAGTFFILGVRKSGSSLLNSIINALAKLNNLNYIDVAGRLFKAGIPVHDWQDSSELSVILAPGNVYGGFRNSPKAFYRSPLFRVGRKLLLVRDPRDALVSEYFSSAYSHSIPDAGESRDEMLALRERSLRTTIDDYVLQSARTLKRTLREYMIFTKDPNCRWFRYEDIIFDKARFIDDVCGFFGWTIADRDRANILGWADVRPSEERPTEFVRRVTPGDHREKLKPGVVHRLNKMFAEELAHFGYQRLDS